MSHNGKIKPPKSLEDVSHLFFSQGGNDDLRKSSKERGFIRRGVPVSRGSGQKVEKSFPDSAALKQILCVEVLQICRGAVLVDAQAKLVTASSVTFAAPPTSRPYTPCRNSACSIVAIAIRSQPIRVPAEIIVEDDG